MLFAFVIQNAAGVMSTFKVELEGRTKMARLYLIVFNISLPSSTNTAFPEKILVITVGGKRKSRAKRSSESGEVEMLVIEFTNVA